MTNECIDICICTYRRPSLTETLASIAAQNLPAGLSLQIIVADNDDNDIRRASIDADAAALGLDLTYLHAPARNISIARNACLKSARNDWIVFIDDDEVATPDWIAKLVSARQGAEVVFGKSQATYPDPATPRWIVAGDFHSNRMAGNDAAWNGYTANALIDRRFVATHNLKFAELLGQIGGEDTIFFFEAFQLGARFRYAPAAVVTELTPLARASFRWLALRRFRSGQVHYMILRRTGGAGSGAFAAVVKALVCASRALLTIARPTSVAVHALRAALHVGVIASALGFATYREYGGGDIRG